MSVSIGMNEQAHTQVRQTSVDERWEGQAQMNEKEHSISSEQVF